MLNTRNPVQSGTYCCTLPAAIYLTDYYVTCIQRQRIFFKTPCDSAGARTQDPNIKSVVLYLLSYEVNKTTSVYCDRAYTKWQFMFHCICCSHMPHFRPLMLYISKNYFVCLNKCKVTNNFSNHQMFYKLFYFQCDFIPPHLLLQQGFG